MAISQVRKRYRICTNAFNSDWSGHCTREMLACGISAHVQWRALPLTHSDDAMKLSDATAPLSMKMHAAQGQLYGIHS